MVLIDTKYQQIRSFKIKYIPVRYSVRTLKIQILTF